MKEFTNSFGQGIQRDVSLNKYPRDGYFWARNIQLVSEKELTVGALINVKGTKLKLAFPTGHSIISYCTIRDTVIFFVKSDEAGKIYKWKYNDSDTQENPLLIYSNAGLLFDENTPVRSIGRYENEDVQKIYFTDGTTFFKYLNVAKDELITDVSLEEMDIVPDVVFSPITLSLVSGGNIKVGKIQYAYQLYFNKGSETIYSPASDLIHITKSSENVKSSNYLGSEVGEFANKSVQVNISNIDSKFTRIRLVALEYTVLYQQPSIRIVGEYNIENLSSITITDTGNSIGSLTMEEFRYLVNNFYPKTIDTKDNLLFAGNIKTEYFDITDEEFDARAFRADSSDAVKVFEGENLITIPHTSGTFNPVNLPSVDSEQFNPFNDLTFDFNNANTEDTLTNKFKYKPGSVGTILGGKGVNIEYDFLVKEVVLDDSPKTYNYSTSEAGSFYPKLNVGVSAPYESNASPTGLIGYTRDEIYRFGIIFLDLKGRESFTKWIGDIRFPSNRDTSYEAFYYDAVTNKTIARILGIKFKVNIPEAIKSKISGYRIVRAERTDNDRTVVAQGLLGYPVRQTYAPLEPENNNNSHNYSLSTLPLSRDMFMKRTSLRRETEDYNGVSISGNFYSEDAQDFKLSQDYLEFDSPDVVLKKQQLPTADAYVELIGVHNKVETSAIAGIRGYEEQNASINNNDVDILVGEKSRHLQTTNLPKSKVKVNSNKIYTPRQKSNASKDANGDATKETLKNGYIYNNQCYAPNTGTVGSGDDKQRSKFGLRGTHALLEVVEQYLPIGSEYKDNVENISHMVGNYRINRRRNLYGGSTYEARLLTKYYPASRFVSKDEVFTESDPTPSVLPNAYIQVINQDTAYQILSSSLLSVNVVKHLNMFINNYGTTDLVITSIILGQPGSRWVLTDNPSGTILTPGSSVYFSLDYIGPETGSDTCSITINTNAVNTNPFVFSAKVDYVNNPEDVLSSTTSPESNITPDPVAPVTYDGLEVYNGDTYISYFVYNRSIYDVQRVTGTRIETYHMYPVESTINLHLRLDDMQKYINWGLYRDSFVVDYKLMENANEGVLTYNTNYPIEVGNLYRYNTAYSSIDKSKEFYSKPFDFQYSVNNDTMIAVSEKKVNGEYIDSWTKFKFNNYINVDSKHGPITRLLTFKNHLYYFQHTGIGIVSVNQRSLIQDNQVGALALGTGGILERFDYVSEKSGSEYHDSIISSDDFIFYADGRRKRINKLVNGQDEPVSIVKGISSLLDTLSWDYVRAGFDKQYNEVIFSLGNTTIAYNEIADCFTSEYTFSPRIMFSLGKAFFSVGRSGTEFNTPWLYINDPEDTFNYSDGSGDYFVLSSEGSIADQGLYKHHVGDPGLFYDAVTPEDSYITLIINPEGKRVCYFDNLDFYTESVMYDTVPESPTYQQWIDVPADIFYKLEASNTYQSIERALSFTLATALNNYNSGTIKRIGRVWRTPVMPVSGDYKRMVDSFLKLTLRYDNTPKNRFKIHDITTLYRLSQV